MKYVMSNRLISGAIFPLHEKSPPKQRDCVSPPGTPYAEATSVAPQTGIETEEQMQREEINPELRYRNTTTIRWTDAQMRTVCDTAWQRRTSVSEMVREMVIEALSKQGVEV
jgi:hypothetical protein